MVTRKPADAALLPLTKTTTGTREVVMARIISSIEVDNPPGVSSSMIRSAARASFAWSIASLRKRAEIGWMISSSLMV